MRHFFGFSLITSLVLLLIFSGAALAQERDPSEVTDDEVNAIARQLYCPVCEDIPLDTCPTLACIQWRELIREQIAMGWSEAQIKNYLLEEYGDMVLPVPPARGFNWLFYVIPPVAILAASFLFYQSLKSWRGRQAAESEEHQQSEPPEDEYIARLEEELRKR
ncbi:MAG: cytochrome c-type biogenesis protein CcmH [Anaerolineales bacterium]|nr:cytochrome c-type biogenesis protein CcmH [Anaerolineales bacterium]